eukprot:CAMPEP_0204313372 /NCGR_PEP_ID=MMETSP0469-20131031/3553_1 /ASSEMBLY_ACC=CAM_ASM_000384 /TAXON_ID=2969 /ORGANISM="Oxyrrhis marina" /LENGTH=80 /DNA_ID=CAMNT_0051293653 /DNA_START=106 /DNA_END=345 /DNA_ORIENTATION=-
MTTVLRETGDAARARPLRGTGTDAARCSATATHTPCQGPTSNTPEPCLVLSLCHRPPPSLLHEIPPRGQPGLQPTVYDLQ